MDKAHSLQCSPNLGSPAQCRLRDACNYYKLHENTSSKNIVLMLDLVYESRYEPFLPHLHDSLFSLTCLQTVAVAISQYSVITNSIPCLNCLFLKGRPMTMSFPAEDQEGHQQEEEVMSISNAGAGAVKLKPGCV